MPTKQIISVILLILAGFIAGCGKPPPTNEEFYKIALMDFQKIEVTYYKHHKDSDRLWWESDSSSKRGFITFFLGTEILKNDDVKYPYKGIEYVLFKNDISAGLVNNETFRKNIFIEMSKIKIEDVKGEDEIIVAGAPMHIGKINYLWDRNTWLVPQK